MPSPSTHHHNFSNRLYRMMNTLLSQTSSTNLIRAMAYKTVSEFLKIKSLKYCNAMHYAVTFVYIGCRRCNRITIAQHLADKSNIPIKKLNKTIRSVIFALDIKFQSSRDIVHSLLSKICNDYMLCNVYEISKMLELYDKLRAQSMSSVQRNPRVIAAYLIKETMPINYSFFRKQIIRDLDIDISSIYRMAKRIQNTTSKNKKSPATSKNKKSPAISKNKKSPATPKRNKSPATPKNKKSPATPKRNKSSIPPKNKKSPATPKRNKSSIPPNNKKSPATPNNKKSPATPNNKKSPATPNNKKSSATPKRNKSSANRHRKTAK